MLASKARVDIFLFTLVSVLIFSDPVASVQSSLHARGQPPAQATVYYVALGGDDANAGTMDHPWRTIQKAADTLTAGDTVYIRSGVYSERVLPQNSGSAGHYVTYAAYPGEIATIDGSGITLPDDLAGLLEIASKSYIRVTGLHVNNAGPFNDNAGILVLNADHIVLEGNATNETNSSGIGVWGSHDVTVDGNHIAEAAGGGWQECISVAGTDTFVVRNNEVRDCYKEGICIKDGATNGQVYGNHVHDILKVGIYVDAWDKHTANIAVYQNVVHDIQDNNGISLASEMGGLLANISVYNNIAYHNRYVGLTISVNGPGAQGQHPMQDITVVNNTFYNNGWETWGGGIAVDNPDAQNVVVRNNIVSQNLYFQITVASDVPVQSFAIDHNLVDGFRGTEGETRGTDSVEGDPLFANAAGADFRLAAGSPARDAGSATGAPPTDFDGRSRPLDGNGDGVAAYDSGAFEALPSSGWLFLPMLLRGQ